MSSDVVYRNIHKKIYKDKWAMDCIPRHRLEFRGKVVYWTKRCGKEYNPLLIYLFVFLYFCIFVFLNFLYFCIFVFLSLKWKCDHSCSGCSISFFSSKCPKPISIIFAKINYFVICFNNLHYYNYYKHVISIVVRRSISKYT